MCNCWLITSSRALSASYNYHVNALFMGNIYVGDLLCEQQVCAWKKVTLNFMEDQTLYQTQHCILVLHGHGHKVKIV